MGKNKGFTSMNFFDSNCMIGRWMTFQSKSFYSVEGLLEEMDYYGIEEALVFHSLGRYYSPSIGNKKLLEEIEGRRKLHGCWIVLPLCVSTFLTPNFSKLTLVEKMLEQRVKAVRLFPVEHNFSLSRKSIGGLLSILEEHRMPLFLDFGNIHWSDKLTDWHAIDDICSNFPQLPVILIHEGIAIDRYIYPLLEEFDNLYLEISYYQVHRGIEAVCKNFGARRLLFGSGMPIYDPGLPLAGIRYANISEKEKKLIGGDNLRRLLEEVKKARDYHG